MDKIIKALRIIALTLYAARLGMKLSREIQAVAAEVVAERIGEDAPDFETLRDEALRRWGTSTDQPKGKPDLRTMDGWPNFQEAVNGFVIACEDATRKMRERGARRHQAAADRDLSPEAVAQRREEGGD